jgi:hypothetical protein
VQGFAPCKREHPLEIKEKEMKLTKALAASIAAALSRTDPYARRKI